MATANFLAPVPNHRLKLRLNILAVLLFWFAGAFTAPAQQTTERTFAAPSKSAIAITNRDGRVSVIATKDETQVVVQASSAGAPIGVDDLRTVPGKGGLEIEARERRERDRIDLTVRVPERSRVRILSEAGAVSVVGNVEFAEVQTNTGTIHADV